MNYSLDALFSPEDNVWQIKVVGEIDIFNSQEFKEELMDCVNKNPGDFHINCSNLEYIDSTALGTLVALLKRVKETGHQITLKNLKPNLNKLFLITNLDKVFIIEGEGNE